MWQLFIASFCDQTEIEGNGRQDKTTWQMARSLSKQALLKLKKNLLKWYNQSFTKRLRNLASNGMARLVAKLGPSRVGHKSILHFEIWCAFSWTKSLHEKSNMVTPGFEQIITCYKYKRPWNSPDFFFELHSTRGPQITRILGPRTIVLLEESC